VSLPMNPRSRQIRNSAIRRLSGNTEWSSGSRDGDSNVCFAELNKERAIVSATHILNVLTEIYRPGRFCMGR
jgi:hypothetical protein